MENANIYSKPLLKEKLILDKNYISITLNETDNWLSVDWKKELSREELLKGAEHLIACTKKAGCTKIINDSSNLDFAWPELSDWFATDYSLRLQKAGVIYFAWIYGDDNPVKPMADSILQKDQSDILVMVFDTHRTAQTWLRTCR